MLTEQDIQIIKSIIQGSKFNTFVVPNSVRWTVYNFNTAFTRQFPSNTVLFINTAPVPTVAPFNTPAVFINDIFTLIPGASLALNCNKDEIDLTIYKATFEDGAALSVWIKEDAGIKLPGSFKDYYDYSNVAKPNKREADKKRVNNRRKQSSDF